MGKLFLDENNLVQFDVSREGAWVRQAETGRGILRLATLTEQLIQTVGKARAIMGREDPRSTAAGLRELAEVRRRIRAQARRRATAFAPHS